VLARLVAFEALVLPSRHSHAEPGNKYWSEFSLSLTATARSQALPGNVVQQGRSSAPIFAMIRSHAEPGNELYLIFGKNLNHLCSTARIQWIRPMFTSFNTYSIHSHIFKTFIKEFLKNKFPILNVRIQVYEP